MEGGHRRRRRKHFRATLCPRNRARVCLTRAHRGLTRPLLQAPLSELSRPLRGSTDTRDALDRRARARRAARGLRARGASRRERRAPRRAEPGGVPALSGKGRTRRAPPRRASRRSDAPPDAATVVSENRRGRARARNAATASVRDRPPPSPRKRLVFHIRRARALRRVPRLLASKSGEGASGKLLRVGRRAGGRVPLQPRVAHERGHRASARANTLRRLRAARRGPPTRGRPAPVRSLPRDARRRTRRDLRRGEDQKKNRRRRAPFASRRAPRVRLSALQGRGVAVHLARVARGGRVRARVLGLGAGGRRSRRASEKIPKRLRRGETVPNDAFKRRRKPRRQRATMHGIRARLRVRPDTARLPRGRSVRDVQEDRVRARARDDARGFEVTRRAHRRGGRLLRARARGCLLARRARD